MAAALKRGVSKLSGDDTSSTKDQEPDKYKLLVTAGPSYDTTKHSIVLVNGADCVTISNEFITAKVKVRVRGYRGLPTGSPASNAYFEDPVHERDQYSLGFSFVPKQDLPSIDTVWGNDFDHPVRDRLPPGFNTAFKIVKEFIDPGLSCDAYADQPWLYGPSLSCWFAFRIGDMVRDGDDFPAPSDEQVMKDGADGSGEQIRADIGLPENNEKRRKFFLNAENRKKLVFQKGRLYQADFYNPYLDFGNLALKLPGFSIKVFKYIDAKSHCLRYVFKNRETGDLYLNVNFNLLWGEELQRELEREKIDKEKSSAKLAAGPAVIDREDHVSHQPEDLKTTEEPDHKQVIEDTDNGQIIDRTDNKPYTEERSDTQTTGPSITSVAGHTSYSSDKARSRSDVSSGQSATVRPSNVLPSETRDVDADAVSQPGRHGQQKDITHTAKPDDSVKEVTTMLENTATDDKRGNVTGILD